MKARVLTRVSRQQKSVYPADNSMDLPRDNEFASAQSNIAQPAEHGPSGCSLVGFSRGIRLATGEFGHSKTLQKISCQATPPGLCCGRIPGLPPGLRTNPVRKNR